MDIAEAALFFGNGQDKSLTIRTKRKNAEDITVFAVEPSTLEKPFAPEPVLPIVAFLAKSLSDENRLRVLINLKNGRMSVSGLVEALQLSQPLVSHHLKELKRSLLVKVERKGPFIYYELADPGILQIIADLENLAEALLANRKTF